MTSNLQLLLALKVSLSRDVTGWPAATQGEDSITHNLSGVDLEVWNDAYIAKLTIAAAANTTVDLRNWTDLLFEAGKSFDEVFGIALKVDPVVVGNNDIVLQVSPGAVNPLRWFFRADDEGIVLRYSEVMTLMKAPTETVGHVVDATHRNLLFANSGTHDLVATVIVLGGHP